MTTVVEMGELYRSLNSALEVRVTNDEKGRYRGVFNKFLRKPGDVLLSVKPNVAALSIQHLEDYCSNCFGPGSEPLKRCTICKVVHYCDSKCQSADWIFHKQECVALQRWVSNRSAAAEPSSSLSDSSPPLPRVPNDAIRCLARILWRRQKMGDASIWAREIDAMQSHRTSLSKDPNARDSQLHTFLAHSLVRYLGLSSLEELAAFGMQNTSDLVDLISRFTTNTFTITSPTLAPLGACVSPSVALINHSCDPNAAVVFPRSAKEGEPLMQVVALKYIGPDEEILTAYIDTTLPTGLRQQALKETYHFVCECPLCSPPPTSSVDWREAMWCPKKCGGVCRVPTEGNSLTRCEKCKAPVKDTDAVLDALRVGQEGLDKAEKVQFSDPAKALQLTTNLIPILISAGLVPASHPLLGLSRLHTSFLIANLGSSPLSAAGSDEEIQSPQVQAEATPARAQEELDEAIRAATRFSTGLCQILVHGHPVRGVALAELGKLLSVDEPAPKHVVQAGQDTPSSSGMPQAAVYPPSGPARLKLAYDTLVRTRGEVMVGFGAVSGGGELGTLVRTAIVDLEKELGAWSTGLRNVREVEMKGGRDQCHLPSELLA